MQRILIDMDDVLADATQRFYDLLYQRHGVKLQKSETMGKDWSDIVPIKREEIRTWTHEDGFFSEMEVMPDSQKVVKALTEKYEVFIVSAANEFPNSLKEKLTWMEKYFPFISWHYIVFCGHKYMIQADYLIDDHVKNLKAFTNGTPLMFTAPHNAAIEGYQRVNNWQEVAKLLL